MGWDGTEPDGTSLLHMMQSHTPPVAPPPLILHGGDFHMRLRIQGQGPPGTDRRGGNGNGNGNGGSRLHCARGCHYSTAATCTATNYCH